MKIEISDELIVEGVARGIKRALQGDALVNKVADAIALRFELLDPDAAAELLGKTARTLNDNHKEWGLDKSVTFGPRYFLSQILERARAKVIKGKKSAALKLEGSQAA
jgi:hypothetical protein